ncbi:MAG: hypothetical protein ACERKN_08160 [Velocimicrobium sp.]
MKKRIFAIVTLTLVLIGLIFFVMKSSPKEEKNEGVFVKEEIDRGWKEI